MWAEPDYTDFQKIISLAGTQLSSSFTTEKKKKINKNFYYHLGERWTVTMKMYKQFNQHAASQSLQVQDITSQKDKYFLYLLQNFCIIF